MAHTIDETLAAATAASNKVDGLIAFVGGLKKQLDDALSGVTLPPAVQAKIDQIFDLDTATATKADAAISTVPPAPAPEPTPATPPA